MVPDEPGEDVGRLLDGTVVPQRDFDLGQPDTAEGDAMLVTEDLRRLPTEDDAGLGRWRGPFAQPGLEVVQGRVDDRRDRDLVDGLHGLVVQRNGEPEVPLHAR